MLTWIEKLFIYNDINLTSEMLVVRWWLKNDVIMGRCSNEKKRLGYNDWVMNIVIHKIKFILLISK